MTTFFDCPNCSSPIMELEKDIFYGDILRCGECRTGWTLSEHPDLHPFPHDNDEICRPETPQQREALHATLILLREVKADYNSGMFEIDLTPAIAAAHQVEHPDESACLLIEIERAVEALIQNMRRLTALLKDTGSR
jgi:hypothetical protein